MRSWRVLIFASVVDVWLQDMLPPPLTIPNVRRICSTPDRSSQDLQGKMRDKPSTPEFVARRRPAIKMFSFFAKLSHGVLEVYGGVKDKMDEHYRKCTDSKIKWKARVNIPSTNMKRPGSRSLAAAIHV